MFDSDAYLCVLPLHSPNDRPSCLCWGLAVGRNTEAPFCRWSRAIHNVCAAIRFHPRPTRNNLSSSKTITASWLAWLSSSRLWQSSPRLAVTAVTLAIMMTTTLTSSSDGVVPLPPSLDHRPKTDSISQASPSGFSLRGKPSMPKSTTLAS